MKRCHFDATHFSRLAALEAGHFWFEARNQLIAWAMRRYFPNTGCFLEVGCGTGFVLCRLQREFPTCEFWGSEIQAEGLKFAAERVARSRLIQMDAHRMPFRERFDAIGAFDVLEHIEDDGWVLKEIYRSIRPAGGLLLTVPQHPYLFSRADETAGHVRRYRASELRRRVEEAGFRVRRMTSFVSLPFPLMLMRRMRGRTDPKYDLYDEMRLGWLANSILRAAFRPEMALIRAGLSFPFGGSLLLVADKRGSV